MTTRLRLALYLRVSTAGQALEGYGLDVQEADCRALAERLGAVIVTVCTDGGVSGTVEAINRPGLTCALEAVTSGEADGIVCASLSRLGRTLTVQEAALAVAFNAGARVFTVAEGEVPADDPDDPVRKMVRQILGAVYEAERATIALRLKKGRAAKRAQGGYAGGYVPMGSVLAGGEVVAVPEELAAVERMVELRAGGATLRAIVATLDAEGVATKRGGAWTATTVRRMLARAA